MERDRMSAEEKKKRGAPKGNQNARKRGFYARVMDEADLIDFNLAAGVSGIDDEIALLRMMIKSLLEREPENIKVIMDAANTLARLLKIRFDISKEQKKGLKEAIGNVLRDIAIPLGIGIGNALTK
jgi:uncharacterized protein YjcR